MTIYEDEFQEIGHCGGQFSVCVKNTGDGHRTLSYTYSGSRPTPASVFAVYALPQGIPVATIPLGGIGTATDAPPHPGCVTVFIGSDSHGLFGHQCRACEGYWRSNGAPSRWAMTCAYCGTRGWPHHFLTEGQLRYVRAFCEMVEDALATEKDSDYVIDMDSAVDAAREGGDLPQFYYAEKRQQNKFKCVACRGINDILGRYGYCSTCGTHNGLQEFNEDIERIKSRSKSTEAYEACVKDSVSAFDSFARQIAKQLAHRVPMMEKRRKRWKRKLFHDLRSSQEELNTVFGIDLFRKMKDVDIDFAVLMFHRRHIYEHNGGEVDQKYISNSGDTSVRLKQTIRETSESATRIIDLAARLGLNLHEGFHGIFPPEEAPLRIEHDRKSRRKKSMSRR